MYVCYTRQTLTSNTPLRVKTAWDLVYIRSQEAERFSVVFPQPFETGLMTVNSSCASPSKPTQFAHLLFSSHCSSCELLACPSGAVCYCLTLAPSLPELPASTTSSVERNEAIYPQTSHWNVCILFSL